MLSPKVVDMNQIWLSIIVHNYYAIITLLAVIMNEDHLIYTNLSPTTEFRESEVFWV